jgi:hypothetical protein
MGQEIDSSHFTKHDFQRFSAALQRETELLETWFQDHRFSIMPGGIAGFELEAWLIDERGRPVPHNQRFLERFNNPLAVPELAAFNVEFNIPERPLRGDALRRLHNALQDLWSDGQRCAQELNAQLLMIGILPTVGEADLNLANMSDRVRYRAINEQVLRMRQGRPLCLDIHGYETLKAEHCNVMLEAATTSFQLHLQVNASEAAGLFNAALIASAPIVAATANSPYLFGKALWEESRIPLFEQAVAVGGDFTGGGRSTRVYRRVTFGSGYLHDSLLELFQENLQRYPPLLPEWAHEAPDKLHHVRLHNGTIWRWNRPLIGFDNDGKPHLRIEHRVLPAGPSLPDAIANATLFYGLVYALSQIPGLTKRLPFFQSVQNFYKAARAGLQTQLTWLDDKQITARALLLEELLPLARQSLESADIDRTDIDDYLGIIQARIATGRTGARWQRDFVACHGPDMQNLTIAYLAQQQRETPVHEWKLV